MDKTTLAAGEPRVRTIKRLRPVRVLIANAKGGSGKTTVATNLASNFAQQGFVTSLLDCDPQESSYQWLQVREHHLPLIHGLAVARERQGGIANLKWRLRTPLSTERVVIDTPAGLVGQDLNSYVEYSDIIVVPIVPSAIDIRAAAEYIQQITNCSSFKHGSKFITVIANRVRRNTLVSGKLEQFLSTLDVPSITTLRDTTFYLRACELGYGLVDFSRRHEQDSEEWAPLMKWINECSEQVIEQDLKNQNSQESSA